MQSHADSRSGPLGPVLKPTGMLTNSPHLRKELSRRCRGNHAHVHLVGGRAAAAQEYPLELCEAICRGLAAQKKADLSPGSRRCRCPSSTRLISLICVVKLLATCVRKRRTTIAKAFLRCVQNWSMANLYGWRIFLSLLANIRAIGLMESMIAMAMA